MTTEDPVTINRVPIIEYIQDEASQPSVRDTCIPVRSLDLMKLNDAF